jgi:dTDP-glucose pyrophosphorylase
MKAVILAAGKGVRLQPLTYEMPKPLIKVNSEPFLYYLLKNIISAGFREEDICIVIGYKEEKIRAFVKEYGFKVNLVEQMEQTGTANAVYTAKDFTGKENFVVVMGDNLYDAGDIKRIANDDDLCYIAGFHHSQSERFGVLIVDNDNLVRIIEKPEQKISDLINTGLYKFTPEIFEEIKRIEKSPRGEYELTDAISRLAEKKKIVVVEIESWVDLGNVNDLEKIEDFLKNNWKK